MLTKLVLCVGAVILWVASVASAGEAISVDPSFSTVYWEEPQELFVIATMEDIMQVGGENNPIASAKHLCAKVWKDNPQLKRLTFMISMPDKKFQEVHCK